MLHECQLTFQQFKKIDKPGVVRRGVEKVDCGMPSQSLTPQEGKYHTQTSIVKPVEDDE